MDVKKMMKMLFELVKFVINIKPEVKKEGDWTGAVTIGKFGIEWGYTSSRSVAANSYSNSATLFALPFKYSPIVVTELGGSTNFPNIFHTTVYGITTTGCTIVHYNAYSQATNMHASWIAVGIIK